MKTLKEGFADFTLEKVEQANFSKHLGQFIKIEIKGEEAAYGAGGLKTCFKSKSAPPPLPGA